jgi:hypothetical protein
VVVRDSRSANHTRHRAAETARTLAGCELVARVLDGAAALAALALVLSALFGANAPTVTDVHRLSASGPESPAPPPERGASARLAASVEGVAFPNLEPRFGWRTLGERSDQIDGRQAETLFYEHEGHVVGYTIVAGEPLEVPADAERRQARGADVWLLREEDGHEIAVFERDGRTCVLSGHVERRSTLVELATWTGHGQVSL